MKQLNFKVIILTALLAYSGALRAQFYQVAAKNSKVAAKTDPFKYYEFDFNIPFIPTIIFDKKISNEIWDNLTGRQNAETQFGLDMQEVQKVEFEKLFNRKFNDFYEAMDYFFKEYADDKALENDVFDFSNNINDLAKSFNKAAEQLRVLDERELEIRSGNLNNSYLPDYNFGTVNNLDLKTIAQVENLRNEVLNRYNALNSQINNRGVNLFGASKKMAREGTSRIAEAIGKKYSGRYDYSIWKIRDGVYFACTLMKDFILLYKSRKSKEAISCSSIANFEECNRHSAYDQLLLDKGYAYQEDTNRVINAVARELGRGLPAYVPYGSSLAYLADDPSSRQLSAEQLNYLRSRPKLFDATKAISQYNGNPFTYWSSIGSYLDDLRNGGIEFNSNHKNAFRGFDKKFQDIENQNRALSMNQGPTYWYWGAQVYMTNFLEPSDTPFVGDFMYRLFDANGIVYPDQYPKVYLGKYFEFELPGLFIVEKLQINFKDNWGPIFWEHGLTRLDQAFDHIFRSESVSLNLDLDFNELEVLLNAPNFARGLFEFLNQYKNDQEAKDFANTAFDRFNQGDPVAFDCYNPANGTGDNCAKTWYLDADNDGFYSEIKEQETSPGVRWKLNLTQVDCDDTDPEKTTDCSDEEEDCNTFENKISEVLSTEGGFVDDPADPGGATNKGISWPVWVKNAQAVIGKSPTLENLKNLTTDDAKAIYKSLYWDKVKADDINDGDLRFMLFDFNVNAGGNAVKVLQRTVNELGGNVSVDGAIGNQTVNAINSISDQVLLYNTYKANRQKYYDNITAKSVARYLSKNPNATQSQINTNTFKRFINGWTNRVNKFISKTSANPTNVNCD